jgi:hypothetical protein
VRLEPLGPQHADGLRAAASDGALWQLRVTSVPEPEQVDAYIAAALEMRPGRLAFAVIDTAGGAVVGTTSYHDIVPTIARLEIGYTWYAKSFQRSHVNTTCKLLLMTHAFETLGCGAGRPAHRQFQFRLAGGDRAAGREKGRRAAPPRLRRDGTVRDTVMYSIAAGEWPEIKAQLRYKLELHGAR